MNMSVAVAEIASKTLIWLALIGAGVRVAPPVLARLGISNTRGRGSAAAASEPASVAVLDGQGKQEAGRG